MSHATWRVAILILLICVSAGALLPARPVAAHAELMHTSPPVDGYVPESGSRIRLWYSQPIASGKDAPAVQVLDERGRAMQVTGVRVDPNDATQVVATIPALPPGTFTVTWSVVSSVDGHPLRGTYAFRVASGLPVGAATAAGQTLAAWAVALRWLTFLGTALALGGFLFALSIVRGAGTPAGSRRRTRAILLGAVVALVATLLEPVGQTLFPPAGLSGGFLAMLRGQPIAWWLRPATLLPLVGLGVVLVYPLRGRLPPLLAGLGAALAALALLGLAGTGHVAGRATWRDAAVAVAVLHQGAAALRVGGLAHLAL